MLVWPERGNATNGRNEPKMTDAAWTTVRRQVFWNQDLRKLRERLAHLVGLIIGVLSVMQA
jgi:hypothetical protein